MNKKLTSLLFVAVGLLMMYSCCKDDDNSIATPPEEIIDSTFFRPSVDSMEVLINTPTYVGDGNFTGATHYVINRLKAKSEFITDNTQLMIFFGVNMPYLKDTDYDNIAKALSNGASMCIDDPTADIISSVNGKLYESALRQMSNGNITDETNLVKALSYLDNIDTRYQTGNTLMPDFVSISSSGIISTPVAYNTTLDTYNLDSLGNIENKLLGVSQYFDYNDYDYGNQADIFASVINDQVATRTELKADLTDDKVYTERVLLPINYDLRKVNYERESNQIVPLMNAQLVISVLPVYVPTKNEDHYIVNQSLLIPFRDQGVQKGEYWWQIGRRHYGPYISWLQEDNGLRYENTLPTDVWINNAQPTNEYASKTYSETKGYTVSESVSIAEKPSATFGISYTHSTTVAQSCPVVRTDNQSEGDKPKYKYTLNQARPDSHRHGDYSVSHDELDQSVFQNHTYAQAWEWVVPNAKAYAGLTPAIDCNVYLMEEDMGWDWTGWTHLETCAHYNDMGFSFYQEFTLPKLERYQQMWDIVLSNVDGNEAEIKDILENHVTYYFDQTFNLFTVTENDRKRIDAVIAATEGSVKNSSIYFKNKNVKSFSLTWKDHDSVETYKTIDFTF